MSGRLLFLALLLCTPVACVVRYGGAPRSPVETAVLEVDLAPIETKLDALIEAESEVDRRDALEAARALARDMKTADTDARRAVAAYLELVVLISERNTPEELPAETLVGGGVAFEDPQAVEESVVAEPALDPVAAAPGAPGSPSAPAADPTISAGTSAPALDPSAAESAPSQPLTVVTHGSEHQLAPQNGGVVERQSLMEGSESEDGVAPKPSAMEAVASAEAALKPSRPPGEILALARAHLKANETEDALSLLEDCPARSCGSAGIRLHAEVCSAWTSGARIRTTREQAAARLESEPARRDILLEGVELDLEEIIRRCPESAAGARNQLESVQMEREKAESNP